MMRLGTTVGEKSHIETLCLLRDYLLGYPCCRDRKTSFLCSSLVNHKYKQACSWISNSRTNRFAGKWAASQEFTFVVHVAESCQCRGSRSERCLAEVLGFWIPLGWWSIQNRGFRWNKCAQKRSPFKRCRRKNLESQAPTYLFFSRQPTSWFSRVLSRKPSWEGTVFVRLCWDFESWCGSW